MSQDADAVFKFLSGGFRGWCVHLLTLSIAVSVFVLDCTLPDGVSVNSLYSLVILVSAYCRQARAPFGWAVVATAASVAASLIAPSSIGPLWESLDRILTIVPLWVAAAVVYLLRQSREAAERERARAIDALEAKGRFLSSASHDLRQPLQSLVLFAGALRDRLQGHGAQPIAETMAAAIEALRGLLDNVLDVSKLDARVVRVSRENFAVGGLLRRLGDEYAPRAEALGMELRIVPGRSWASSDAALVERVLRNLLENALIHAGGRKVLLGGRRRGDLVRIDVIDAGQGIPADQLSRIFEEFYQIDNPQRARALGHGLGLSIARRIADLLGHRLDVRSVPGRGTEFSLWLPAAEAKVSEPAKVVPERRREVSDIQVLVVEDDPLVLPAVRLVLEGLGCTVTEAQHGADAVDMARDHPPELVISDFRLPGMNGIETISAIRVAVGRTVPASLLTGDLSPAIESECRRLGMGLLRKPVREADLAALVAGVHGASERDRR